MQRIIQAIYPAHCVACDTPTQEEFGLCGPCWAQTQFITGTICDACGTPLPGTDDGTLLHCDDCITLARPWTHGRAALVYSGVARRLVLGLKHGDRTDLARPAGRWMAQRLVGLVTAETIFVPVPLHRWRLIRRRYNQAALLAQAIGQHLDATVCVDAAVRTTRTAPLDGVDRQTRFETLSGAITANPKRAHVVQGRPVMIVDDVMTSGATLAATTQAMQDAGAADVSIVTLARVVKDA